MTRAVFAGFFVVTGILHFLAALWLRLPVQAVLIWMAWRLRR